MEFLITATWLGTPLWLWASFASVVTALLAFDLGLFNRKAHEIGIKESLKLSLFYIVMGVCFGFWVWYTEGRDQALDYYTGYVIEKSLSLDNLFVMAVIFGALGIPRSYQHRVLFWGILGVIVLRGLLIAAGATIIHNYEWVLYIFAAFIVFTGFKLLFKKNDEDEDNVRFEDNKLYKFLQKYMPLTPFLSGQKFLVRKKINDGTNRKKFFATPLLLALVLIELTDLLFALDSIPAIFAITTDPFIVLTSNVFAVLGLRALYFALAAVIARFAYVEYAVSLVLIFIGGKVFVPLVSDIEKVPSAISLSVTLGLLSAGIIFSWIKTRNQPPTAQETVALTALKDEEENPV